jgi:hypothetical protein
MIVYTIHAQALSVITCHDFAPWLCGHDHEHDNHAFCTGEEIIHCIQRHYSLLFFFRKKAAAKFTG